MQEERERDDADHTAFIHGLSPSRPLFLPRPPPGLGSFCAAAAMAAHPLLPLRYTERGRRAVKLPATDQRQRVNIVLQTEGLSQMGKGCATYSEVLPLSLSF